jgi:hypothetical protein
MLTNFMPDNEKPKCVRDLRGPKADVLAKLPTNYDLPPETLSYLTAKAEAAPHAGLVIHAHEQSDGDGLHVCFSITKLFVWAILLSLFQASAFGAITSSNLVTYAATGGASTNNGVPVLIGTAYISTPPSFIISDGGTTTTNAISVDIQYGLDTNNFTTQTTYTKSVTNATEGVITPGVLAVKIYARTRVVTTNGVSVGTKAVFNQ